MKLNIEQMAREAGFEAWDIGRDAAGVLRVSLDGVSLLPELEHFAQAVAKRCAEICNVRPLSITCAEAIREEFGVTK